MPTDLMTDRRIGSNRRIDHTPGTIKIERSPFKRSDHLIAALIVRTNQMWRYRSEWIGGHGVVPCAAQDGGNGLEMLYQDSLGGWWLQCEIMTGTWIPDIDRTLALAQPPVGDDVSPMNAEHIRHEEA